MGARICRRTWRLGALSGSEVESVRAALVPAGVHVSGLGEGNGTHQPFCSWNSIPKIPALLAQPLRLINLPPLYPRCFSNCHFYLYLSGTLCCAVSLMAEIQLPLALQLS